MLKSVVYRVRYAWRLHTHGGLTILQAFAYPTPGDDFSDGDPIEDADAEIFYASEG